MKILGAQIYGYGKLENKEISDISPKLQVFYGQNEAGKSTLMSFIHSILFGFPTKQQQELRYEPKTGTKYGGKLLVHSEIYGTLMIERIPGKASGDVSVYLPDGTKEDEVFLRSLFNGMDKTIFQNIYSFDIHGLQGVHRLKPEDIGKYLFSSGAIGTDAIYTLNQHLDKEMEQLFKPNGRKPILNAKLAELKDEQQIFSEWQGKINKYEALVDQQKQLNERLNQLEAEKKSEQKGLWETEQLDTMQPLLAEYEMLCYQLEQLPPYKPFPENGLQRLEYLLAQMKPYEAQLSALTTKSEEWTVIMDGIALSLPTLDRAEQIKDVQVKKNTMEERYYRLQSLHEELIQITNEVKQLKEKIQMKLEDTEILNLDTSIQARERITKICNEEVHIKQQKQLLDEGFYRSKATLEEYETKVSHLISQILSESEIKSYKEYLQNTGELQTRKVERNLAEKEMETLEDRINTYVTRKKVKEKKISFVFGISFLLSLIYVFLQNNWALSWIPIILIVIFLVSYKAGSYSDVIEELSREKQKLQDKIKSISMLDIDMEKIESFQQKLIKDQQIKQQIQIYKQELTQQEKIYEKAVSKFESWEEECYRLEEKAKQFKLDYVLSLSIDTELLLDVYQIIERMKEKVSLKKEKEVTLTSYEKEWSSFLEKVKLLSTELQVKVDDPFRAIELLVRKLEEESRKYEEKKQYEKKIIDVTEEITTLTLQIRHIYQECNALYEFAEVKNEEEFREKAKFVIEAQQHSQRLSMIDAHLAGKQELRMKCSLKENYKEMKKVHTEKIEAIVKQEKEHQYHLSEVTLRIEELEEGGNYSDILHSLENKKSSLKEDVKRWAVYAVAKDIVKKTTEQYQNVRLPSLISKAESYFHILSDGKYSKVFPTNEGDGFIVESSVGIRYKPSELSQATAEQLYISIRFALAKTIHPNNTFPFIIDDSFVNFDSQRLEKAVSLLREISMDHQVLLFTCHDKVKDHFKNEIINL